jgi:CHRD domain
MRFIVFALAALVAVSVFAVRTDRQTIEAAPVEFTVELTGAKENPPVNIGGSAVAKLSFDDDTNLLTYTITVSGVPQNQVTAAHIHQGGAGTNGPIRHTLTEYGFTQLGPASVTLNSADEDLLKKGELYLNIHSNTPDCGTCASGFARGQMIVPGTLGATQAPAPPAENVNPPRTGDGGLADSDAGVGWIAAAAVAALVLVPGVWALARKRF